jgi:hypothetical protein
VAGRCRASDTPVAAAETLRYVVAPADLAVVASGGSGGGGEELPATIALGRGSSGTVVLLMRFTPTWKDAEVQRAFVLLDAVPGAMPGTEPITFEMARVRDPWQPSVVSWGRQPRLDVPIAGGSVHPRPSPQTRTEGATGAVIRVDVTPLVRALRQRGADDHGIALLARGDDAYGTVVAMAGSQGAGPRLEVYVK